MEDKESSKIKDREKEKREDKIKPSKKKNKNRSRSRSKSRNRRSRSKSRSKSRSRDRRRDRDRSSSYNKDKRRKRRRDSRSISDSRKKRVRSRSKSGSKEKSKKIEPKQMLSEANISSKAKSSNFSYQAPPDANLPVITPQPQTQVAAMPNPLTAKVDRKLYIGNLPAGINPATLVKLLNAALSALKANLQPGDPVLSSWISSDGHYAFVEFRTAEEANNGFLLNNISILGQPLKVGRPKTYSGSMSSMDETNICNTVAAALSAGTMNAPISGNKIQLPTRILCFKNIVKNLDIENEEIFNEIKEDIREECSMYGQVLSLFIPRKDVEDNPTPGMGNVYIEFASLEEAKDARRSLCTRKFNEKFVNIIYFSEEKYANSNFDLSFEKEESKQDNKL